MPVRVRHPSLTPNRILQSIGIDTVGSAKKISFYFKSSRTSTRRHFRSRTSNVAKRRIFTTPIARERRRLRGREWSPPTHNTSLYTIPASSPQESKTHFRNHSRRHPETRYTPKEDDQRHEGCAILLPIFSPTVPRSSRPAELP